MKTRTKSKGKPASTGYCKVYRHWRSGKIMRAKDYGYKAWPFGGTKRRK